MYFLINLLDETRRAQAIELLDRNTRSIKQRPALVGFSNEKRLARAFKGARGLHRKRFGSEGNEVDVL